ncbi:MAG: hypothetical protein LR015_11235 [Verrucomicrobia bacterium]|nr:hypothetical protein [Verrucomicrobiota bacterium]
MMLSIQRIMRSLAMSLAAGIAALGSGCASTGDALMPGANYDRTAASLRSAAMSGDVRTLQREVTRLERRAGGGDRILYLQEQGRLLSLAGDLDGSIRLLQEASDHFEAERMRPELALSSVFFSASSLALNDLALPYRGFSQEKIMVHNLLATNYLRQGDLTRARIELNRADLEQNVALEQNQRLAARAEQQASQRGISMQQAEQSLANGLPSRGNTDIRNSFQNAFTFALSGLLFELTGSLDRAVIEYRRALEIQPGNRQVRTLESAALRRLNGQFDPDELSSARVVVLYDSGLVDTRAEFRIPFFLE